MIPGLFMNESGLKPAVRRATALVAACSGAFCAVAALLLAVAYVQWTRHDPLDSPALTELHARLAQNESDEALRAAIRTLDLQSRRAFFVTLAQMRTGGWLLLAGAIVFVASSQVLRLVTTPVPRPPSGQPGAGAGWEESRRARRALAAAGGAGLAVALGAGLLATSPLATREAAPAGPAAGQTQPAAAAAAPAAASFPSPEELRRNWPCFRGPGGNGVAAVTQGPTNWNGKTGAGVAWAVPVPKPGFSSPVVWSNRVFITGADKTAREVYAFDGASGKLLWTRPVPPLPGTPAVMPKVSDDTGLAAPTVVTDGRRVVALFATGELMAVDLAGNVAWTKSLGVPDNHYGHSSSLMMYENLLLLQLDQSKNARLIALEAATGKPVWEKAREVEISWSSPIVVNTGKRDEVILTANPFVISYAPRTGQELWRVKCLSGEVGPSAAYAAGMVYAANEYVKLVGISVAEAAVKWVGEDHLPNCASPVATEKYLFTATGNGTIACFDSRTGAVLWTQEYDEGAFSSPVLVGDTVYLSDLKGNMRIFKAAPAFKLVGDCPLGEACVCTPAFVGGRMYIRGFSKLYGVTGTL